MLANLSAYDFGYISVGELIERTNNTITTMAKLERYRGHFYNWYDTISLSPMLPLYISTVDSGNLAGHLLTLRSGLMGIPNQVVVNTRLFEGLLDTFNILIDAMGGSVPESLKSFNDILYEAHLYSPVKFTEVKKHLDKLVNISSVFFETHADNIEPEAKWWAQALVTQSHNASNELSWIAPWIDLPNTVEYINKIKDMESLNTIATLNELLLYEAKIGPHIDEQLALHLEPNERAWLEQVSVMLHQASSRAADKIKATEYLILQSGNMTEMDYDFLYNNNKHLLNIGYHVSDRRIDPGYYDLLASEARLGYFVAIALGKLPQESWFALSRKLQTSGGKPILLSWSGSMFEYLMPLLVMPNYPQTLLNQTYKAVVKSQIDYGRQRNVTWGISESGYYMFDASLNYQYHAFGVPGLGMKRDLADDLVIAPYATFMALMVAPEDACKNLQSLSANGLEGRYGLYEAIDYTSSRMLRGKSRAIIHSFMAHHQGMSFLSLSYLLLNQPMQKRFCSEPLFQATMLLLHEKIPKAISLYSKGSGLSVLNKIHPDTVKNSIRVFNTANTNTPEINLLSNGRYHVAVTNAGGSYSCWNNLAITRWYEDSTRDNWGTFCYIRDIANDSFWSTAYQPTLKVPENYEVIFCEGRAEFSRRDGKFDTHTEIVVSPEDDIELRRSRITNRSTMQQTIEVTSYAEVVLATAASDATHPAFSNLFVQTEIRRRRHAIVCRRRPRSFDEPSPSMFHLMSVHGAKSIQVSYETDRLRFIGRGETTIAPQAIMKTGKLSGSQGAVLDPIVAIRNRITLEPEQTVTVDIITGIAENYETCIAMIDKYQDTSMADRVFELAWTHAQVILRQLNVTEADAQLYSRIASSVIYPNASLRADATVIMQNRRGQSGLWSYAISGDLPIVLLQIKDIANINLVRQMVQAHAYWRLKGLVVDLVIWNEDNAGYRQELQDQILSLIAESVDAHFIDKPGGIFIRPSDQISPEDRILLESVACVIIADTNGSLEEHINRQHIRPTPIPHIVSLHNLQNINYTSSGGLAPRDDLILFNGLGGSTQDGREYVIKNGAGQRTPAPWVNVIANPDFGTVISESGQSYTWSENSHEYRLTPWNNDPVSDPSGEAFYLRDEDSGQFWSPMPKLCYSKLPYLTRHGFGYSVFEHIAKGIHSELTVYVATDAAIKFSVLNVKNVSGRKRQLSATGYVEWVLADIRSKSKMQVITELDPKTGAIFAYNAYNTEFKNRIAFFDVDDIPRTITGDRREFIGRNGSLQYPAAMNQVRLSGKVGATLDPCAAIQVPFELADGNSFQIVFKLGVAGKRFDETSNLIRRFRGNTAARAALDAVHDQWNGLLGAVQIETPDPALNVLANGWLMYQTISCRLWARSGYYQSGGAFGFRDQLQDAMALVHNKPELLRSQIMLHAAHQFVEGDVQHWWHYPSNNGVRTKCSDDYLWLPFATCRYVTSSGDTGILNERVPFIEGRQLNQDEQSYYAQHTISSEQDTLYQHCVRAILHGLNFGTHGLPIIGSCDWNDGMDKVGQYGKGESVWLSFFLYDLLIKFADIASLNNDNDFALICKTEAECLRKNINKNAWDGEWYLRAYFDDGSSLGSSANAECQIDALSQSWAVLSGAGDKKRSQIAMDEVNNRLVCRDKALIKVLAPPFDKSDMDPGYIRGYPPGVRENGGQYTHAAIWTAMAFAKMGDNTRAFDLLQMLNPFNHARTPKEVALYKVEPYVVAADIYGVEPHTGRGGWSWYTGSSGWLYRLILESILGLQLNADRLSLKPCAAPEWNSFKVNYRYRNTIYAITVNKSSENTNVTVDGVLQNDLDIILVDDNQYHNVDINRSW